MMLLAADDLARLAAANALVARRLPGGVSCQSVESLSDQTRQGRLKVFSDDHVVVAIRDKRHTDRGGWRLIGVGWDDSVTPEEVSKVVLETLDGTEFYCLPLSSPCDQNAVFEKLESLRAE